MRASVVGLSLIVLAAAGVTAGGAAERVSADESTIARIMVLAEGDLQLRQAELGLIGSTLSSPHEAALGEARIDEPARVSALAAPVAPAAPARPASKTIPAAPSISDR